MIAQQRFSAGACFDIVISTSCVSGDIRRVQSYLPWHKMDHRSAMVSVSCVIHAANASHCQEVITAKIQAEHCNGEMCGLSQSYPKPKLCLQLLKITQSRNGQRRWFVICNDGFCDWRPGLLYAACCMVAIVWEQYLSRKLSLHLPFLSSLCYAIRRRFSLRSILRKNYNAINRLYYPILSYIFQTEYRCLWSEASGKFEFLDCILPRLLIHMAKCTCRKKLRSARFWIAVGCNVGCNTEFWSASRRLPKIDV